ncbi:NADH-quinone oxidoreductase subunit NuoN [Nocardioides jejuensis]|uniref:NADH-quinone oxidoreductase subunit N n=1 Tax=Nocardioides jejuensis TaxID=2502782 RepID=A0A4R1BVE2_9ACTN|nr:NADH-quinone oxidoreductase subunit NuoN [Nocardioides jejuensis]TCJ21741.1 NADH-quinone oxidoreductase subunit NuoN [Nocardioides jejuensis]
MTTFQSPHLGYDLIWPLLLVLGAACVGIVVEAFVPRAWRYVTQVLLTLTTLAVAFGGTIFVATGLDSRGHGAAHGAVVAEGSVAIDGPAVFAWGLLLIVAFFGVLLFAERHLDGGVSAFSGQAAVLPGTDAERRVGERGLEHTEVYPLLLFAVGGMLLFAAANDLLTLFVALEVLSLPLYLLTGLARRRRLLSQEAAMKYFLLGAFSSGFLLYGIALVYGYAGTVRFGGIADAIANTSGQRGLLLAGIGLLSVGLLFKVGAVPFQAWTPDVYQGAPTPVTAFMAAGTKVAAFVAMLRLFSVAFGGERWTWLPMLWAIALLTMVIGAVLAVAQTDVKRMLAYSSIAHTGFVLTGILGTGASLGDDQIGATQAVLFYLVTYGLMTLGAFAVLTLVRDAAGESGELRGWAGLARTSPVVAAVFSLFLLSLAGLPFTAGFTGKWVVFASAMSGGAWPVVVAAVLTSAMAAFFYIRVIVLMYFSEPVAGGPAVAVPSILTSATIAVTAVATVVLGVVPGPVLDLAAHAGDFIR